MSKANKKVTTDTLYPVAILKGADEFSGHADILSALFDDEDCVSKEEARAALKKHFERKVN